MKRTIIIIASFFSIFALIFTCATCASTATAPAPAETKPEKPEPAPEPEKEVKIEEPKQQVEQKTEKKEPVHEPEKPSEPQQVKEPEPEPPAEPVSEPETIPVPEPAPVPEQKTEPEPAPVPEPQTQQKPEKEEIIEVKKEDKRAENEYERSTSNVSVSKEVFEEDKTRILAMIDELDAVMKNVNYKGWLTYLDETSKNYWSRKANLQKASSKLPRKGLMLRSLEDYFKFVFIPARIGRTVDEIRYETETQVKVVQVGEEADIVYYNFLKENGKWKLRIPPISD